MTAITLGAYLFAFAVLPVLHTHGESHHDCNEVQTVQPNDVCEVCKVIHTATPLFELPVQIAIPADTVTKSFTPLFLLPIDTVIGLPPCRAPPMI
ncbi:hypothetical protein FACS189454_10060 [Planctomycetales bacterium]|nr:hypothetical protein FACS189454_10060 [Planctomycetales bacterium]